MSTKKSKLWFALSMLLMLSFAMTACGPTTTPTAAPAAAPTQAAPAAQPTSAPAAQPTTAPAPTRGYRQLS